VGIFSLETLFGLSDGAGIGWVVYLLASTVGEVSRSSRQHRVVDGVDGFWLRYRLA